LQDTYGWEVGAHCTTPATHTDVRMKDPQAFRAELAEIRAWQTANHLQSSAYAYPVGPYDAASAAVVSEHYDYARSNDGQHSPTAVPHPHAGNAVVLGTSLTLDDAKAHVDKCVANKTWLSFVVHRLNSSPSANDWTPANFAALMDYIKASGATVATVADVLSNRGRKPTVAATGGGSSAGTGHAGAPQLPVAGFTQRFTASSVSGALGSAVGSWPSLVGSSALVQETTTKQPLIAESGGLRHINFDGTDDQLTAALSGIGTAYTLTFVVQVWRTIAPSTGNYIVGSMSNGGSAGSLYATSNNRFAMGSANITETEPAASVQGDWVVVSAAFSGDGVNSALVVDDVEKLGTTTVTTPTQFLVSRAIGTGATGSSPINLREAIIYPYRLTSAQIKANHDALKLAYGIA
jgi:hypothetical protein